MPFPEKVEELMSLNFWAFGELEVHEIDFKSGLPNDSFAFIGGEFVACYFRSKQSSRRNTFQ